MTDDENVLVEGTEPITWPGLLQRLAEGGALVLPVTVDPYDKPFPQYLPGMAS